MNGIHVLEGLRALKLCSWCTENEGDFTYDVSEFRRWGHFSAQMILCADCDTLVDAVAEPSLILRCSRPEIGWR